MSSLKDKKSSITDRVDAAHLVAASALRPTEVVIGRIVGIGTNGAPLVDFPENPAGKPVPAMVTARYDLESAGRDIALMFISGDLARPLAIGLIAQSNQASTGCQCAPAPQPTEPQECLK